MRPASRAASRRSACAGASGRSRRAEPAARRSGRPQPRRRREVRLLRVVERDLQERLAGGRLSPRGAPDERDRPRQPLGPDRPQLDRRAGLLGNGARHDRDAEALARQTADGRHLGTDERVARLEAALGHRPLEAPAERGVLAIGDQILGRELLEVTCLRAPSRWPSGTATTISSSHSSVAANSLPRVSGLRALNAQSSSSASRAASTPSWVSSTMWIATPGWAARKSASIPKRSYGPVG